MPRRVDLNKLSPFPKLLPEKLKKIRKRLKMTPAQIAAKVGARTGAEIIAYEKNEDEILVSVLWAYAKIAGVPIENLIYDDRDLWLGHRQN